MAIAPLQLPDTRAVSKMDFSGLERLGEAIRQNRINDMRQQALAEYAAGNPKALLAGGDLQLANLYAMDKQRSEAGARDVRDFQFRQQQADIAQANEKTRLGLAERQQTKREEPTYQIVTTEDESGLKRPVRVKVEGPEGAVGGAPTPAQPNNPFVTGPLNADQSKAATFTDRMANAHKVITGNEGINQGLSGLAGGVAQSVLPEAAFNLAASPQRQQSIQAQRDFVNAILRKESGAVIGKDEFDNAQKQYFPQVGDSPEVIIQKRMNRITAMQGMAREAGRGYRPPGEILPFKERFDAARPSGTKASGNAGGVPWSVE